MHLRQEKQALPPSQGATLRAYQSLTKTPLGQFEKHKASLPQNKSGEVQLLKHKRLSQGMGYHSFKQKGMTSQDISNIENQDSNIYRDNSQSTLHNIDLTGYGYQSRRESASSFHSKTTSLVNSKQQNATFRSYYAQIKQRLKGTQDVSSISTHRAYQAKSKLIEDVQTKNRATLMLVDSLQLLANKQYRIYIESLNQPSLSQEEIQNLLWQYQQQVASSAYESHRHPLGHLRRLSSDNLTERQNTLRHFTQPYLQQQRSSKVLPPALDTFRGNSQQPTLNQDQLLALLQHFPPQCFSQLPPQQPNLSNQQKNESLHQQFTDQSLTASIQSLAGSHNPLSAKQIESISKEIQKQVMKSLQSKGIIPRQEATATKQSQRNKKELTNNYQVSLQQSFLTDEDSALKANQTSKLKSTQLNLNDIPALNLRGPQTVQTTSTKEQFSPRLVQAIKDLLPSASEAQHRRSACIQTDYDTLPQFPQSNISPINYLEGNERQNMLKQQQYHFLKSMKTSHQSTPSDSSDDDKDDLIIVNQIYENQQHQCSLEPLGTATFRQNSAELESHRKHMQSDQVFFTTDRPLKANQHRQPKESEKNVFQYHKTNENNNGNSRYQKLLQSKANDFNREEEDDYSVNVTTHAIRDVTCADPAADLSLVMYNTVSGSNHEEEVLDQSDLNENQLKTLNMFDAGFKTFFPHQEVAEQPEEKQSQQLPSKRHMRVLSDVTNIFNDQSYTNNGLTSAAVSRYFNEECEDISVIRGGQGAAPHQYKRPSIEDQLSSSYRAGEDDYCENSCHLGFNLSLKHSKSNNGVTPKHSGIDKLCLIKQRPSVRTDDCSFEYSKAEGEAHTHLLNQSSFEQFIGQMDPSQEERETERKPEQQRVQQVPRLRLDQIEEKRRVVAAQKQLILSSLGLS